jgi:hypothetical protein
MTILEVESTRNDRCVECVNVWCSVAISDDTEIGAGLLDRGGFSIIHHSLLYPRKLLVRKNNFQQNTVFSTEIKEGVATEPLR